MKRVWMFCIVLFFALTPLELFAQRSGPELPQAPVSIQGIVRDAQTRQPIPYVRVILEADRAGYAQEMNTDQQGRFKFEQLAHVVYYVRVKMPGYKGTSQMTAACDPGGCRRVDLSLQTMEYVEFSLVPLPNADAAAPAIPPGGPGAMLNAQEAAIPEAARKEFQKGQETADAGKYADSIPHFKKAIELYPKYDQAYVRLGMAYMDQKNWKDAQSTLTKATEINAENPGAFLALGIAYSRDRNFPAAEAPLVKGLQMNPDVAEAQCELSLTYWALKKFAESDAHAQKCATLKPDYAQAHLLLGNLALAKRNPQVALQEYREYLKLEPNGAYAAAAQQQVAKLEKDLGSQATAK